MARAAARFARRAYLSDLTRISIEQAKGIISEQAGISMDAAFERLRGYTRNHNQKLGAAARAIVAGTLGATDLTSPADSSTTQ